MKRLIEILSVAVILASSCSEPYDLQRKSDGITYLAVEAYLTDDPSVQSVKLTESVPYIGDEEVQGVSGARVTVSFRDETVVYRENPYEKGLYNAPENFCGEPGVTYSLRIERTGEDGTAKVYEATETMPVHGLTVEKIDYKYSTESSDSTWYIGFWGKDDPKPDYYLVTSAINGEMYPMYKAYGMDDYYFSGAEVKGYPVSVQTRTWEKARDYGYYTKPFETGDILTMMFYEVTPGFSDFFTVLSENVANISIPILSSQPANLPCNIKGENVTGYFGVCSIKYASCIIDDPYRTTFLDGTF